MSQSTIVKWTFQVIKDSRLSNNINIILNLQEKLARESSRLLNENENSKSFTYWVSPQSNSFDVQVSNLYVGLLIDFPCLSKNPSSFHIRAPVLLQKVKNGNQDLAIWKTNDTVKKSSFQKWLENVFQYLQQLSVARASKQGLKLHFPWKEKQKYYY